MSGETISWLALGVLALSEAVSWALYFREKRTVYNFNVAASMIDRAGFTAAVRESLSAASKSTALPPDMRL